MPTDPGKLLVTVGIIIAVAGLLVMAVQKTGFSDLFGWFGNLPLDFRIKRNNVSFYFPLGTSIVLSIILSLLLYFFNKFIL